MKNETKRAIVAGVKGVVGAVGGFSAGYVVDGIVKATLPAPAKLPARLAVIVGQSFLSGALADAGVTSACETIDGIADIFIRDEELEEEFQKKGEELAQEVIEDMKEEQDGE